ncbi:sensory rhodopsin transducer [Sorangium sp. So ce542]
MHRPRSVRSGRPRLRQAPRCDDRDQAQGGLVAPASRARPRASRAGRRSARRWRSAPRGTSARDAQIAITVDFSDRDPARPYRVTVPARRTRHVRFNDLTDPEPIPRDTDYASLIESDVPIVVQHTRLDSRQAENALISTIAYTDRE